MRRLPVLSLMALAACAPQSAPVAETSAIAESKAAAWTIDPGADLNGFFECLEREGATLVSAHRGGYGPGLPENAIETMRATLDRAPALLEVDVAASADGVLYLMHDETLDRTTTGTGPADALPMAEIERLFLEDKEGAASAFHPPRFAEALAFAKDRTLLQIDFKPSAKFEDVIAAIRAAGAERRVILIAYSVGAARKLARLAPEMMISLSILSADDLAAAKAARLSAERLLAFTGLDEPNAALFDELNAGDIEVIFGTLGRDGLDRVVEATGDASHYVALSKSGVDILATDRAVEAHEALDKAGRGAKAGVCGVRRG